MSHFCLQWWCVFWTAVSILCFVFCLTEGSLLSFPRVAWLCFVQRSISGHSRITDKTLWKSQVSNGAIHETDNLQFICRHMGSCSGVDYVITAELDRSSVLSKVRGLMCKCSLNLLGSVSLSPKAPACCQQVPDTMFAWYQLKYRQHTACIVIRILLCDIAAARFLSSLLNGS